MREKNFPTSPHTSDKPVIALDVDGVLLDYSSAYAKAWERAFGMHPTEVNPHAFWPHERWGVPWLEGEQLEQFRAQFDDTFWSTLPALAGAVEACHRLVDAGYELIAVTAIESQWLRARLNNLQLHGFPILQVIATGGAIPNQSNPKAEFINRIKPVVFIDDYPPFLEGIHTEVHKVLIRPPRSGCPTSEQMGLFESTHPTLSGFVQERLIRSVNATK